MIKIVIADDHHLVRQGIRALLEKADDMEVVGEAEDGQQAIDLVEQLAPDVLVTDVAMPRLNGSQAAERVRALGRRTRVVILSMYSDETIVRQALLSGARGYVLKRSVAEELLLAVRAAFWGDIYLSPPISGLLVAGALAPAAAQAEQEPTQKLSPREREVWQLVAEGRTTIEIANLLLVSPKTIEKHRASIMTKLNVHDLPNLTRLAIKHGLIPMDY